MAEPSYFIRQGDVGVVISDTLLDANNDPVSIQGATVKIVAAPLKGGTNLLNTSAVNAQVGDGSDGTKGKVSYTWQSTESSLPGLYLGSWEVTYGGGAVQTFPNAGYLLIEIAPDAPTTKGTLYVQQEQFKATIDMQGHMFAEQDIATALEASSRAIDELTGRRFYLDADANQVRYYSPCDPWVLEVDDVVTITSLKTDEGGDGTFENTWTLNTHYTREPLNAALDSQPYTTLRVHPSGAYLFPTDVPRSVELTGKFGWPAIPPAIEQATTILAHRLLKRARQAPFGVSGIGLDGSVVRIMMADPDVVMLVRPFMNAALVA